MSDGPIVLANCVRVVALLGQEWGLSPEEASTYAHAIAAYVPELYNDAQLQRIARYYHLDHQEVQALRDPQAHGHLEAWAKWPQLVRLFLHNANLDWVADTAVDVEDLVQIALRELYEAIDSYHFGSRFSTWAYTVILRAARHAVRAKRAAKRSATLVAIDDPETLDQLGSHADDPAALAQSAELITVINGILEARGGLRWVEIFQCWAHEDQRLVDIGRQVGLSAGRVSVLIEQMRSLLRQNPDLLEWYRSELGQGDAPNAGEKQLGDASGEITA